MDGPYVGKERRIDYELEFFFDIRFRCHVLLDNGGIFCFPWKESRVFGAFRFWFCCLLYLYNRDVDRFGTPAFADEGEDTANN